MALTKPTNTPLHTVLARLRGVKRTRSGYQALCPAHDDKRQSLSISEETPGGKVLVFCHRGCDFESVVRALGLEAKDLFPATVSGNGQMSQITATYDYADAEGHLLFQVCRFAPKSFRQRRPDGFGGWVWNTKGVEPVLYRLPEVLRAAASGDTIYVCEGEKDVEALRDLGLTATTNPRGAGKWRLQFVDSLKGARVVILPDNDEPGRQHAQAVAASLLGKARSIKILELPGLPPKGDVSDWLAAGGTRQELERLVSGAAEGSTAGATSVSLETVGGHRFSDTGLAERLARDLEGRARYCSIWKQWLVWEDKRWARDTTFLVERLAKQTALDLYNEAADTHDDREREEILRLAKRATSAAGRDAMLSLARSEPSMPILPDALDAYPWLLNTQSGTLDLKSGTLREHKPSDLITKICNAAYDTSAQAPVWLSFLDRAMQGDAELISYLQRVSGYALTGDTSEHCFFFLHGSGRNGKSTFINALQYVLGDYSTTARPETFLEQKAPGQSNDIAALKGARLVATVEVSEGRRLAEGLVKQLVGGDRIAARFLYSEFFQFTPEFKLFMAANSKPLIRGTDTAIWERIHLIPFEAYIPPEERDKRLGEKLRGEADGILRWMVQGCLDWQRIGLAPPHKVRAATAEYRSEMDVLASFVEECCVLVDESVSRVIGTRPKVRVSDFYKAYHRWCEENAERPLSKNAVSRRLADRGIQSVKGTGGVRYWLGIGLRASVDDELSGAFGGKVAHSGHFP